jgi:RNA-directed DNA polymerase
MRARLADFALTLHPGKTRLIEFGRHAARKRRARGLGKPETFNFLGFTHISGHSRRGEFQLKRKSRSDRVRARLQAVKEELRRRMHETIDEQGAWLRRVVMGFNAYHAVPTNAVTLSDFRHNVADLWRRTLRRRGQKGAVTWDRMTVLTNRWLPRPRITHPWPDKRFAVKYPMWEPGAEIPPAGICAGARSNACLYRDSYADGPGIGNVFFGLRQPGCANVTCPLQAVFLCLVEAGSR